MYSYYRNKIKSGDLIAWRGLTPLGKLVRSWTREPYAHVGLAYAAYGRVFVIHARPFKGVVMEPLSRMLPAVWSPNPHQWSDALARVAFGRLGLPYAIGDALRAGLGLPLANDGRWQCAEFASDILGLNCPTPGKLIDALGVVPTALEKDQ